MSNIYYPRMFTDLQRLGSILGMEGSEVLRRLYENGYVPAQSDLETPFTADPENPNLLWGPEFNAGGCTIATSWLRKEDTATMQIETGETLTADDARELAAILLDAAAELDNVALPDSA